MPTMFGCRDGLCEEAECVCLVRCDECALCGCTNEDVFNSQRTNPIAFASSGPLHTQHPSHSVPSLQ